MELPPLQLSSSGEKQRIRQQAKHQGCNDYESLISAYSKKDAGQSDSNQLNCNQQYQSELDNSSARAFLQPAPDTAQEAKIGGFTSENAIVDRARSVLPKINHASHQNGGC